jgi:hypothetical protein
VRRRGSGFKRWEEKRRCQHFSTSFIAGSHREVQEGLLSFNFAREYAIQNGDRDKLASLRAMRGELAAIAKPIRGTQFKASGVVDARLGSLAEDEVERARVALDLPAGAGEARYVSGRNGTHVHVSSADRSPFGRSHMPREAITGRGISVSS